MEANNTLLTSQQPEAGGASLLNSNLSLLGQTSTTPSASGGSAIINLGASGLSSPTAGSGATDGISVSVNPDSLTSSSIHPINIDVPLPATCQVPMLPQALGSLSSASTSAGQSVPEIHDPAVAYTALSTSPHRGR